MDPAAMGQMVQGMTSIYATAQQGRLYGAQASQARAQADLFRQQAAGQQLANRPQRPAIQYPAWAPGRY